MEKILENKKVAVLVDNGFEQIEFTEPLKALKEAGAEVKVIARELKVKAWDVDDWGEEFDADIELSKANATEFDALLLPGGVMNPDKLRMDAEAVNFVKYFVGNEKPIAAICHGPWTLIDTGMIEGRKMTSYPTIKTDLINAGVEWVDKKVVVDRNFVTSRKPSDIPDFNKQMLKLFAMSIEELNDDFIKNELNAEETTDEYLNSQTTDRMIRTQRMQIVDDSDRFMTRDDDLKQRYTND